jgi:GT2 family glycosyltransferase
MNKTPMNQPLVAIVILNWNGKSFLEKFLPSVLASSYTNKKIIVADNASSDDSVPFLRDQYPMVEIIQNPNNGGFAKGYNLALKQVCADYYVLLNSDVEVTPGWIEPVIDLMESDKLIGACQPKLLAYHSKDEFEYAGASGGWIDNFGYPFTRGRVLDIIEKDNGQYNDAIPCFWATGAALFVRSSVYHEMKGLDDYFFAHQEEIDLCWRMQLHGYKIFVQPASVVYHVGGGTLPKGNSKKVYLNYRNNLIMMAKNLPFFSACWKIGIRFGLDALSAYKVLLSGDGGYYMAVAKAHFGFLHWLFFEKNNHSKFKKSFKELEGVYMGSILVNYFIKKKRTFAQIISKK